MDTLFTPKVAPKVKPVMMNIARDILGWVLAYNMGLWTKEDREDMIEEFLMDGFEEEFAGQGEAALQNISNRVYEFSYVRGFYLSYVEERCRRGFISEANRDFLYQYSGVERAVPGKIPDIDKKRMFIKEADRILSLVENDEVDLSRKQDAEKQIAAKFREAFLVAFHVGREMAEKEPDDHGQNEFELNFIRTNMSRKENQWLLNLGQMTFMSD